MFSNDNNIETIAQLAEELKKYATLQGEYARLNVVEKTVKLLTALLMTIILTVLVLLALTYFSFALAYGLASLMGYIGAFSVVGGIYLLLFVVCICNRKRWIERPLVRFLANILME